MRPVIMHLIDSFRQGGSESQALNLYLEMKRSGRFDVKLACLDRSGPLLRQLPSEERDHVPEFKLNSFYDAQMARQLYRFAGLLRRLRIDAVHTHDFYTNVFGMLGARLAGVPVRLASRREAPKRPTVKRLAEHLAYRFASAVIANCDRIRTDLLAERVAPQKIVTVHNGVHIEHASLLNGGYASGVYRGGTVTIVANLRPVKDHATFLRAARRVVEACRETSFVLAGEGDLEPHLRDMAVALGIADQVHFAGRCEDVPALLAQSDVCVLSSKSEGFSNAILEYMAAARPVVATRAGGADEAITEGLNGFLVDPGDDMRMAERIILLLKDPRMARRMGDRGREIAVERFSRSRQLGQIEKLYESLLAGSGAVTATSRAHASEA